MRYICALTIAGSDSCGGAGVQADIKTMSALGVYAASAITSITVQNTMGVQAIQAVKPEIVAGQIKAVMDDIKPLAIKIGMVNDKATIQAIADTLKIYSPKILVVDPVMVSTSGSMLMQNDALGVFCSNLLPMATLLTPNIPEAEVLSHTKSAQRKTWTLQPSEYWSWDVRLFLLRADTLKAARRLTNSIHQKPNLPLSCMTPLRHETHMEQDAHCHPPSPPSWHAVRR